MSTPSVGCDTVEREAEPAAPRERGSARSGSPMTLCRPLSRPRVVLGAAIIAAMIGPGCKEDPPPGKLFEEDGSYELVRYDLDGSGYSEIQVQSREAAFLMKLDAKAKVAQTAMCAENEDDTPETSLCRLAAPDESF